MSSPLHNVERGLGGEVNSLAPIQNSDSLGFALAYIRAALKLMRGDNAIEARVHPSNNFGSADSISAAVSSMLWKSSPYDSTFKWGSKLQKPA